MSDAESSTGRERARWRRTERSLFTRPIQRHEFPKLLKAMEGDDLLPLLTDGGLKWYHGRYIIAPKVVREAWGITINQYRRLVDYILEEGICEWE